MANTSTLQDTVEVKIEGLSTSNLYSYIINYDTIDTDLVIRTATAGMHTGLFGMSLVEANAGNLTLKSNTTVLTTLELGANAGIIKEVDNKFLVHSKKGEALVISSSITLTPFILYVATFQKLYY